MCMNSRPEHSGLHRGIMNISVQYQISKSVTQLFIHRVDLSFTCIIILLTRSDNVWSDNPSLLSFQVIIFLPFFDLLD